MNFCAIVFEHALNSTTLQCVKTDFSDEATPVAFSLFNEPEAAAQSLRTRSNIINIQTLNSEHLDNHYYNNNNNKKHT